MPVGNHFRAFPPCIPFGIRYIHDQLAKSDSNVGTLLHVLKPLFTPISEINIKRFLSTYLNGGRNEVRSRI